MACAAGQFGPERYAAWRTSSLGDITEELEHRLLLRLAGPLKQQSVLDVGCGDGTLAALILSLGAARVAGCDTDRRMLARARAADRSARIAFAAARAQALPFPDASFDVVFCVTVLAFIADADFAIREMARVLRPGGRLVLGDLGKWSVWAMRRRIRGWFGASLWRACRFRSGRQLARLVQGSGLHAGPVVGAIFFPPWAPLARAMAPLDPWFGRHTTLGAAFLALRAERLGGRMTACG